jgi:hypothetical protein
LVNTGGVTVLLTVQVKVWLAEPPLVSVAVIVTAYWPLSVSAAL